jgi:3-oxoadipate enol-lactonase
VDRVRVVEQLIPVPDGEIWAEDNGGDGPAVVLAHPGDWADSSAWTSVVDSLRGRHRVIRYDNRGFGRSPAPTAPFTLLGDLRAVLDHAGVTEAVVAGHSGGGGTALGLALAAPERVTALVLTAPGVQDYPWPAEDPYMVEAGRLIAAGDRDGLVTVGLHTWARAGDDAIVRSQIRNAVSSWFAIGGLARPDPPAYDRLAEIRAPAVMVLGGLEYPMVADASNSIAARIPGCETVLVPEADHMLPLRAPSRIAELIADLAGNR